MLNLYYINDTYNGFFPIFLTIITFISLLAGILTITTKNPILSVLYLILLFTNISCYLIFVGAKFLGISYILVYVGAVSILFLFILMLINIRVSELVSETTNYIPLAILTILIFFVPLSGILPDKKFINDRQISQIDNFTPNTEELKYVSSFNWDTSIIEITDIASIGNIMYSSHSLWLILTSFILLLAMVGSIVITVKQKY